MSRPQPFSLKEFESIYSRVPRLCVDLVIKTEEGILLTLRKKNGWIDQWHLPGGTVYMYESVTDTINRVAMEELGIELEVIKMLGYLEYPTEKKERGYGYSVALSFLCRPLTTKIVLDDQVDDCKFFKELPENTIAETKEFLSKL